VCQKCKRLEAIRHEFLFLSPGQPKRAKEIHQEARRLYSLPEMVPFTGPEAEVTRQLALRMSIARMLRNLEPIVCPGSCTSSNTTPQPS
jgi:hypothetical protein